MDDANVMKTKTNLEMWINENEDDAEMLGNARDGICQLFEWARLLDSGHFHNQKHVIINHEVWRDEYALLLSIIIEIDTVVW